jgi:hypothetical protein
VMPSAAHRLNDAAQTVPRTEPITRSPSPRADGRWPAAFTPTRDGPKCAQLCCIEHAACAWCGYCAGIRPTVRAKHQMHPAKVMRDDTVARLSALATQLQECLADAQDIRARFTKARAANMWPDLPSRAPPLTDDSPASVERTTRSAAH